MTDGTTEAGPDTREPETEAGRRLHDWLGWHPVDGRDEYILAIEAELRAKLAAEVEGIQSWRDHNGTMRPDKRGGWIAQHEAVDILRGDSGGAA